MRKTILIGLTAFSLLALSADAKGFGNGCKHHKSKVIFKKFLSVSDLTESQEESLKEQFRAMKQERKAYRSNQKDLRKEKFLTAITDKGFDKEKFVEAENLRHSERTSKMADNLEKLFTILTPAQIAEFKAEISK